MDRELLYLKKRARMARQATCGEARCAHDAFVRAYLEQMERRLGGGRSDQEKESAAHFRSRQLLSIAAMPEHVG